MSQEFVKFVQSSSKIEYSWDIAPCSSVKHIVEWLNEKGKDG